MEVKMRICKDCNEKRESSFFYGVQKECKECTRKRVRKREEVKKLDPEWVEKEKERHREKYHRLQYKDLHKPSYEQKKLAMKNYNEKYPEKRIAKNRSQNLKLVVSGNNLHHWSYNEEHYRDVIELSISDHNTVHRFITYDQERMMYRISSSGILLDTKEKSIDFYNTLEIEKLNQKNK